MASPYDIQSYLFDRANIQDTLTRMVSNAPFSLFTKTPVNSRAKDAPSPVLTPHRSPSVSTRNPSTA